MATIKIKIKISPEVLKNPKQILKKLEDALFAATEAATELLRGELVKAAPTNTGLGGQSLRGIVRREKKGITSEITSLVHLPILNKGFRSMPNFPPEDAIELWVKRKLGITNSKEANRIAYLIARKIKKEGIQTHQGFIDRTVEKVEPRIQNLYKNTLKKVKLA